MRQFDSANDNESGDLDDTAPGSPAANQGLERPPQETEPGRGLETARMEKNEAASADSGPSVDGDSAQDEPIMIELHSTKGSRQPLGEPLDVAVRVVNVSDEPVWMVGVVPGSEGLRYPQYRAEIEGPTGPVEIRFPEDLDYVPGLRTEDFVRLAPGESFDPQGKGFSRIQQLAWFRPLQPGRYRLRLRFDASSQDVREWMGHTAVRERRRLQELIERVPPVQIWSNTLEIEFD